MAQQRTSAVSAWAGWALFGAFLMGIAGLFQIITGLAALFRQEVFLITENTLVVLDYTQWGLIHLGVGALLFLSAFALASGRLWGRIIGVLFATASALINFVFIQAYPLWSTLIIFVDIIVIYSIAMHGKELRQARGNHSR